jgi:Swt1-like HEPN
MEAHNRSLHESVVASLGGRLGDVARVSQWTSALSRIASVDIGKLYPSLPHAAIEVAHLQSSVTKSLQESGLEQQRMSAMLGLERQLAAGLEVTRFKLSAFAGVTDVLGPQTLASTEAYRALFGQWQTRPDLPENFWRDARVRRRMYDAAEVDPGLAQADLKIALEVVVQSGLASGIRSDANAVAIVSFGDVSMTIRSQGTRGDAYRVLERFEEELRAYITRKLSERFGPDWFKLRVDGNIAGEAKRIRKQALERGEAAMPLVNYTELGHLASIVRGRKNWEEVFADVFVNQTGFDQDMQKLVAARRPTMHIRPIDGLRLVELICVVKRLSSQMEDDGAWKIAAEAEQ